MRGREHERAERCLLGAILIHGAIFGEASAITREQHFASEAHRLIWKACGKVTGCGFLPDLVTVVCELDNSNALGRVGGAIYVASLVDRVPDVDNVRGYATLVRDYALERRFS